MPHINIKMWPGRTEEQKQKLTDKVINAVKEATGAPDDYITVAIEEISSSEWAKKVYKPEIADKADKLYKKPGYGYTDEELNG